MSINIMCVFQLSEEAHLSDAQLKVSLNLLGVFVCGVCYELGLFTRRVFSVFQVF